MKKTLLIDFDGTIHSYENGWQNGKIYGTVIDGFFDFVIAYSSLYNFAIFSTRSSNPKLHKEMKDWVEEKFKDYLESKNLITSEELFTFPTEKPISYKIIDDRAISFNGSWNSIPLQIRQDTWIESQKVYEKIYKFVNCILSIPYSEDNNSNSNSASSYYFSSSDPGEIDSNKNCFKYQTMHIMKEFQIKSWTRDYEKQNYDIIFRYEIFYKLKVRDILKILSDLVLYSNVFDTEKHALVYEILDFNSLQSYFINNVKNKDISILISKLYLKYG